MQGYSLRRFVLGAIIFGSDQEVAGVMRAVRRNNATGAFSWIGSDGWSARNLVSDGNEPEVSFRLPAFSEVISSFGVANKRVIKMVSRMQIGRRDVIRAATSESGEGFRGILSQLICGK